MYALIDCNNFYVSCERAFNPRLENKPVIVLSNNDGCIISRSNEAKKLGIPMGAPFFKWQSFCKHNQVFVFSSNYELYGDMSQRVMELLKAFNSNMEIYSIDEAFLFLNKHMALKEMQCLRYQIKMCTGIPISIGVSKTKTLAKIANYLAKASINTGVFYLSQKQESYLSTISINKIWGIGRRLTEKLNSLNIYTAKQLRDADSKMLRLHFNVTLEKTVQELQGISCFDTENSPQRKQIISSRSFGKPVTELSELEEAVSHYISIAALKLRKQNSVTSAVYVYLQTNHFKDEAHKNTIVLPLPTPTADTSHLIHLAKQGLSQIYQKDYRYRKAGVMLMDISQQHNTRQFDMLLETTHPKSEHLMSTIDSINKIMGKNTVFLAAEGIKRAWSLKCDRRSPRYTTRWNELPIAGS